jgi:general secretion pathway protein H
VRSDATGRRGGSRAARLAGFTLLEILVVVLIIGIMTGAVLLTINFTGKDTALATEGQRLLSLMDYAQEQAELQTRDYGILFSQRGYVFVVYDVRQGAWRPVYEDDALRARTLPIGLDFNLVVDARPIVLQDSLAVPPASAFAAAASSPAHSTAAPQTGSDSNSDSGGSNSDSDSDSGANSLAPQVMIFSSGDLSAFKITLERPAAGRSITLDENQDGDIVEKPMVESGT